jgi:hypothetical protein
MYVVEPLWTVGCLLSGNELSTCFIKSDSNNEQIDPFLLANRLHTGLNPIGIVFIDGLVAFQENSSEESAYFPVDGHLTPAGNQILGDFLAEQIIKNDELRSTFEAY